MAEQNTKPDQSLHGRWAIGKDERENPYFPFASEASKQKLTQLVGAENLPELSNAVIDARLHGFIKSNLHEVSPRAQKERLGRIAKAIDKLISELDGLTYGARSQIEAGLPPQFSQTVAQPLPEGMAEATATRNFDHILNGVVDLKFCIADLIQQPNTDGRPFGQVEILLTNLVAKLLLKKKELSAARQDPFVSALAQCFAVLGYSTAKCRYGTRMSSQATEAAWSRARAYMKKSKGR